MDMEAVYKKYLTTIAMIWGVCIVGFLAGYMMIIVPVKESIIQAENELTEKQGIMESAKNTTSTEAKQKLKEEMAKLHQLLAEYAVSYENAAGLTFDISKIVTDKGATGFKINTVSKDSFVPIQDCKYIGENVFKLKFKGTFQQFAYFLNRIERNTPVIFVNEFSIEAPNAAEAKNAVSMEINVFVLKPKDS